MHYLFLKLVVNSYKIWHLLFCRQKCKYLLYVNNVSTTLMK